MQPQLKVADLEALYLKLVNHQILQKEDIQLNLRTLHPSCLVVIALEKKKDEDPKRRKMDGLIESKEGEQSAKTTLNMGSDSTFNKGTTGASG
ncbi:hypothetical protein QN277_023601 [Acacia crassicarpa]|uniref:Uncharacterized protein n=1 Tax=Acacia crassicarpa TaxID=499986 RepID=A0AAE1JAE9_9FABA|nr:hypothetical protein QN277_023601 [Acacia crassicarpa]